ncbi:MAG: hypothetical protein J6A96_05425 [Clostridia bacterium]|nr:hypothetical protein [Clostridia bacterium]
MEENKGFVAFFRNNFDIISKLFLNHIAMCVFGLVVSLATKLLNDKVFKGSENSFGVLGYIMCGVGVLLYLCLIYVAMWEKGASDKIKIDGGRLAKNNFKGLLFWLVANSIDIFLILNLTIVALIGDVAKEMHAVVGLISMLYNGMYYPILWHFFGKLSWLFFVVLIPGAIVATLSYISALKGHKCIFPEPKGERNRKMR